MDLRLLGLGVAWLLGWYLCLRVRRVPYAPDPDATTAPTVVIPARDEERTLPTVLAGLASQTTAPAEVIVVDDRSTDTTAAIAAARGARVVVGEPLPPGWTGKAWSLHQGVEAADTDVVVCLDADVDPSSHLIARVEQCFDRLGGLVSVQPYHEMHRWWERAAAFFNLIAVMGVGLASPGPSRARDRAAFGPCLVASRDALLLHLSHRSVRHAVIEDMALARRFAAAGVPVTSFAGGDLLAFRMYDRPRDLANGFAKNFAAGAGATPIIRLVAIVAWVTACLVGGWGVFTGGTVALAIYGAFALQCFVMLRQLGNFGVITALLYPLNALIFVAVFVASLGFIGRGRVRWKGRTIRTRGRRDERR